MDHQDWTEISLHNPSKQKIQKKIVERKGDTSIQDSLKKIDNETENFTIIKVPPLLSKEIISARITKKLTQKDIAIKLNIQQSIYTDIENGKAIYNSQTKQYITKIERLLGVKFENRS